MLAVVSVDKHGDASVIVVLAEELKEQGIEIVRKRNEKFSDSYCYLQQNVDVVISNDEYKKSIETIMKLSQFEFVEVEVETL